MIGLRRVRAGRHWLCVMLLVGTAASHTAQGNAPQNVISCVQSIIQPGDRWASTFEQTQHLSVLTAPLFSSGKVVLDQGTIRWTVLEPIRQTLTIDAAGRMQSDDGTTMDHPAIANLVKMLLTLDTVGLESAFTTTGDCSKDASPRGWVLALVPKDPAVAALFDRIDVQGGVSLHEVTLHTRSGDYTTITFSAADKVAADKEKSRSAATGGHAG